MTTNRRTFNKFWIWTILHFLKSFEKIHFSVKSDNNNCYFSSNCVVNLWQCLTEFFLKWEILQPKFAEKIKTQILFLITLFPKIVFLNNVENYCRVGMTITYSACALDAVCLRLQTQAQNIFLYLLLFSETIFTQRCLNYMLYIHCLSWA